MSGEAAVEPLEESTLVGDAVGGDEGAPSTSHAEEDVWVEVLDETTGAPYYVKHSGESRWAEGDDWVPAVDGDRSYYYNIYTGHWIYEDDAVGMASAPASFALSGVHVETNVDVDVDVDVDAVTIEKSTGTVESHGTHGEAASPRAGGLVSDSDGDIGRVDLHALVSPIPDALDAHDTSSHDRARSRGRRSRPRFSRLGKSLPSTQSSQVPTSPPFPYATSTPTPTSPVVSPPAGVVPLSGTVLVDPRTGAQYLLPTSSPDSSSPLVQQHAHSRTMMDRTAGRRMDSVSPAAARMVSRVGEIAEAEARAQEEMRRASEELAKVRRARASLFHHEQLHHHAPRSRSRSQPHQARHLRHHHRQQLHSSHTPLSSRSMSRRRYGDEESDDDEDEDDDESDSDSDISGNESEEEARKLRAALETVKSPVTALWSALGWSGGSEEKESRAAEAAALDRLERGGGGKEGGEGEDGDGSGEGEERERREGMRIVVGKKVEGGDGGGGVVDDEENEGFEVGLPLNERLAWVQEQLVSLGAGVAGTAGGVATAVLNVAAATTTRSPGESVDSFIAAAQSSAGGIVDVIDTATTSPTASPPARWEWQDGKWRRLEDGEKGMTAEEAEEGGKEYGRKRSASQGSMPSSPPRYPMPSLLQNEINMQLRDRRDGEPIPLADTCEAPRDKEVEADPEESTSPPKPKKPPAPPAEPPAPEPTPASTDMEP